MLSSGHVNSIIKILFNGTCLFSISDLLMAIIVHVAKAKVGHTYMLAIIATKFNIFQNN